MAELIGPAEAYCEEFLAAEREFAEVAGERLYDRHYDMLTDFAAYVRQPRADQGQQPPEPGRVPSSWFWLVDAQTYIGRVSLRHRLNPRLRRLGGHIGYEIRPALHGCGYGKQILALALKEATGVGLRRVLLVCSQTNDASQRIIETNGGVLEGVEGFVAEMARIGEPFALGLERPDPYFAGLGLQAVRAVSSGAFCPGGSHAILSLYSFHLLRACGEVSVRDTLRPCAPSPARARTIIGEDRLARLLQAVQRGTPPSDGGTAPKMSG